MDFERLAVPLTPPAAPLTPPARVLDLMASSDLVMQPGNLMRLTAKTPFSSASAYLDPIIWNTRRFHNMMPLLVAQLAVMAGAPNPDVADWMSELIPSPAADMARAETAPSPPTVAPEPRTPFAPQYDVKVGQVVRLEGTTPDGRTAGYDVHPTLWNLGQEDHYESFRGTVLLNLGIDPTNPAHADAAAAVMWKATVVEAGAETSAPAPAPDTAHRAEGGLSDLTTMIDMHQIDMRQVFGDEPATGGIVTSGGPRR